MSASSKITPDLLDTVAFHLALRSDHPFYFGMTTISVELLREISEALAWANIEISQLREDIEILDEQAIETNRHLRVAEGDLARGWMTL